MKKMRFRFDEKIDAGEKLDILLDQDLIISFVWCPPGEITLSDDIYYPENKYQKNQVKFTRGFWFTETLITHEQWKFITGEYCIKSPGYEEKNLPVSELEFTDILNFVYLLNQKFRSSSIMTLNEKITLPNIAQWEYACNAGNNTNAKWFFGFRDEELHNYAWFSENSENVKHPVKSKLPNQWGIYDIYGNVLEPCYQLKTRVYYRLIKEMLVDPISDDEGEFCLELRGGAFDLPSECCLSDYTHLEPLCKDSQFIESVGIRLICF